MDEIILLKFDDGVTNLVRGDHDYCRVTETRQLSSLKVGEDNKKFEPTKLKRIQNHQYCQTKDCFRGF